MTVVVPGTVSVVGSLPVWISPSASSARAFALCGPWWCVVGREGPLAKRRS